MTTEFQMAMDNELSNLLNSYGFLDDILIVTKGTQENPYKRVTKILERLNKANIRLKWKFLKFRKMKLNG